jgi:esterase/lipase
MKNKLVASNYLFFFIILGESKSNDDLDLSADTLSTDVGDIIKVLYPENPPNIMLLGHSMGGAIAVHISHLQLIPTIIGCCVIDVVEGTAIESLQSMQSFLRSRPKYFKNIMTAIECKINFFLSINFQLVLFFCFSQGACDRVKSET